MILPYSVLHGQEICHDSRRQPVCLDGSRADDMSSYRVARRRAVLMRSVVTVSPDELMVVGISSLRMTITGDLLQHSMGTALLDGLTAVDMSS
jgi:hypothetical protein